VILLNTEIDLERNLVRHVEKFILQQNQLECHRRCFRSLSPSRSIIGDRTSLLRGSSRTEIANQRRDRPRGKTWQRGKAPHRQHDEEVLCAPTLMQIHSCGGPSSRIPVLLSYRSYDQKSHDETDRALGEPERASS